MDTDAKIAAPEFGGGTSDKDYEPFEQALPMPGWHREELIVRLAKYRAGQAGEGRHWPAIRVDLKSRLTKARKR